MTMSKDFILPLPTALRGLERVGQSQLDVRPTGKISLPTAWSLDLSRPPARPRPRVVTVCTLLPGPKSSLVTRRNYTFQKALRGARRLWLRETAPPPTPSSLQAAENYRPQSAWQGEKGRRRSEPRADMVGWVLKPAHEKIPVPKTGREAALWAGQGGAEELSEAEAQAGGAGKGVGPEEGETLKRKQQQFELL